MRKMMLLLCGVVVGCSDPTRSSEMDVGLDTNEAHDTNVPEVLRMGGSCVASDATFQPSTDASARSGTLSVLTYNVAGLPEGISQSHPSRYTTQISPLLNRYDLVLAQEDFSYHSDLISALTLPFGSPPFVASSLGDGLATFARNVVANCLHVSWNQCNGIVDSANDCLTPKGFSVVTLELAPGILIDAYDLHADAGGSPGDAAARSAQVAQLIEFAQMRSGTRAMILGGDTNMNSGDEANVVALLSGLSLTDTCRELQCGQQTRIDRIMYRNSDDVRFTPSNWRIDNAFVTAEGEPLSDHVSVAVDLGWTRLR